MTWKTRSPPLVVASICTFRVGFRDVILAISKAARVPASGAGNGTF
jgi:hypothetical protein